jgi:hypothetical protein
MSASIVQKQSAFATLTDTSPSWTGSVSVTLPNPITAGNIVVLASAIIQTNGSTGLGSTISGVEDNLGNGYAGASYDSFGQGNFCSVFQGSIVPQAGAQTYTLTFDPPSGTTGYEFLVGFIVYEVNGAGSGFNFTNESAHQSLTSLQNINNLSAQISSLSGGTYGNLLIAVGAFTDSTSLTNAQAMAAGSGWTLDARDAVSLAFGSSGAIVFESQLVSPGNNPAAKFSGNATNTELDGTILVAAYSLTSAISGGGSGGGGGTGNSTTFLGSVRVIGSAPGNIPVVPFLGIMKVVASAPSGPPNPYLGSVILGSPSSNDTNPALGEVVVVTEIPAGEIDVFLGAVEEG